MSRLVAHFIRFLIILFGFFCAALGASAFLHLLLVGLFQLTSEEVSFVSGGFWVSIPFVALFVGYFAFIPAMVGIVIAEVLGRRDWLFYSIGGAIVGVIVAVMQGIGHDPNGELTYSSVIVGLAATGIVGGLCYWLVSGRTAGQIDRL